METLGQDDQWQVLTLALPSSGKAPALIITYGEMNTLADFYGDLETMKSADPKDRRSIVQSVRKETFLRLKEIYDKIRSSLTKDEAKDEDVKALKKQYKKIAKTKFAGSAAVDFISGVKGQADLLAGDKPLIGQSTGAQGEKNKYGATLARNMCHFVPESWHAWARDHGEAIALARQAFAARDEAKRLQTAFDKEDFSRRPLDQNDATLAIKLKEAEANRLANDALLNNGFGDHYLQDSYASGHMINKTQIMQWYVEFVDTNKEWDYFKEKNWRKVQQMAYNQPGLADAMQYNKKKVKGHGGEQAVEPRNPQSVEDLTGDWTRRFNALGLQVPTSLRTPGTPERVVMEWWQSATGNKIVKRELSGAELAKNLSGMASGTLQEALMNLSNDGIVRLQDESVERRGARGWAGVRRRAALQSSRASTRPSSSCARTTCPRIWIASTKLWRKAKAPKISPATIRPIKKWRPRSHTATTSNSCRAVSSRSRPTLSTTHSAWVG